MKHYPKLTLEWVSNEYIMWESHSPPAAGPMLCWPNAASTCPRLPQTLAGTCVSPVLASSLCLTYHINGKNCFKRELKSQSIANTKLNFVNS